MKKLLKLMVVLTLMVTAIQVNAQTMTPEMVGYYEHEIVIKHDTKQFERGFSDGQYYISTVVWGTPTVWVFENGNKNPCTSVIIMTTSKEAPFLQLTYMKYYTQVTTTSWRAGPNLMIKRLENYFIWYVG